MKTDNNKPERKVHRLKDFDYSSCGAYFITFNTKGGARLSEIQGAADDCRDDTAVYLLQSGRMLDSIIKRLNDTYETVNTAHYVIMPNHVHMIIETGENNTISISCFVGLIKRLFNKEYGGNIWQKSFYDHIITSEEDYCYHCQYIDENPKKWSMGKDKYYV